MMNATTSGSSSATRIRRRPVRSAESGDCIVEPWSRGTSREWQAAEGGHLLQYNPWYRTRLEPTNRMWRDGRAFLSHYRSGHQSPRIGRIFKDAIGASGKP